MTTEAEGRLYERQRTLSALDWLVRLADAILRPLDRLSDCSLPVAPLGSEIRALTSSAAFRGPINRAASRSLGWARAPLARTTIERLSSSARSRLALLFISESPESVRQAALVVAASILHRRVSALLLKADRLRAAQMLGPEGFAIATHEAPVMHAALADLDRLPDGSDIFAETDQADPAGPIVRFGLQALGRYIEAVEPEFVPLFAPRLPAETKPASPTCGVAPLSEAHIEQIVRVVRRRMPSWPTITG